MLTPQEINRPPDTEELPDAVLLNDVIEAWLENLSGFPEMTFPDALRFHYTELVDILRTDNCDPELAQAITRDLDRLNVWLLEFTQLYRAPHSMLPVL